ncbi:pyrroline-5-carboxylate reductase [Paenibacillus sambharensis]|uniref:Pyrroline-5-carboxylate reductase n=1 Tax=Paenibacillus sambharensis TaxID=1803190 RepID=A0A2W1L646_9BACL|nr:pyrroline-5-carboxylate reductase [Paenibacillus sambharensis]PZD93580.1 pyrroline-5-carboxylate reductase [Paenibacillus sambharensis]
MKEQLTKVTAPIRDKRFCFYGAGSMAEAILRGIVEQGLAEAGQVSVINRSDDQRLAELNSRYGVVIPAGPADKDRFLAEADILFLCMKPKDAEEALGRLTGLSKEGQLVVSVIAGLSTETIERLIGRALPIVRTMPNTSSTIGLGATALCFNGQVSEAQQQLSVDIFQAVGITTIVEEPMIDSVTGLSGSGPAYIYYVMEALMQAGIDLGLSPESSRELTIQTVLGAASMVHQTGEEPSVLRRKVSSPNGTTQAAIEVMDRHDFTSTIIKAVRRSAERAREMGAELERSTTQ